MTALQLIVSEVLRHQLGRAGSDVPPPRLSGSSEPASSQVAEPDPTADHKHQSRPALPWAAAARGAGGTCPLVRGGVVTGAQHPSRGPAGWWLPPGCPGRHPVGPRSSKSVRAMPRLAPRSGRDAAWRKERANGILARRSAPGPPGRSAARVTALLRRMPGIFLLIGRPSACQRGERSSPARPVSDHGTGWGLQDALLTRACPPRFRGPDHPPELPRSGVPGPADSRP